MTLDIHTLLKLETALIQYDERQRKTNAKKVRGYYNPHALGIYLHAFQEVKKDVESGNSTLAQALYDHFHDRLLSTLEKSVGLPLTYGGGGKSTGRPKY